MLSLCLQFHINSTSNLGVSNTLRWLSFKFLSRVPTPWLYLEKSQVSSCFPGLMSPGLTHCRISGVDPSFIPQNFFINSKHLGSLPGADLPKYPHPNRSLPSLKLLFPPTLGKWYHFHIGTTSTVHHKVNWHQSRWKLVVNLDSSLCLTPPSNHHKVLLIVPSACVRRLSHLSYSCLFGSSTSLLYHYL